MEKYLKKLSEQFKQATGTKSIDFNSQAFISEFGEWIRQRQLGAEEYLSLLDYMNLSKVNDPDTAEIGKGRFDTIVKDLDTTIITPYSKDIIVPNPKRIITSDFRVYEGTPILMRQSEKGTTQIDPIITTSTLTFMTQNPYSQEQIANWEELHNGRNSDIIVGIYGSIYDKDTESKIRQIEDLRDKLDDSYAEEYAVFDDTYCYAIASTRKVKRLVKTLTR